MKNNITAVCRVLLVCFITSVFMYGCAALQNLRTSREVVMKKPPYYHGRVPRTVQAAGVANLPTGIDPRLRRYWGDADWTMILNKMDAYLESMLNTRMFPELSAGRGMYPDVYIGSPAMMGAPVSESGYESDDDDVLPMVCYYLDPSREWKQEVAGLCREHNIAFVISLSLGFSEYMIHQKSVFGKKEVWLGTDHTIPVPWLSSLESPVDVIYLTGALVDSTGKIRRVGAEGILAAEPSSLFESIIGLRKSISDDKVQAIAEVRRQDLDTQPLAWQEALRNLVNNLVHDGK